MSAPENVDDALLHERKQNSAELFSSVHCDLPGCLIEMLEENGDIGDFSMLRSTMAAGVVWPLSIS